MNKLRHVWQYSARNRVAVQESLRRALGATLLLLPCILLSPLVNAQDVVQRVTLETALEMFAQNNLELRISRAGVLQMSGLARQARAYPNPSVAIMHEPLFESGQTQSESYLHLEQRIEWPALRSARAEAANRKARAAIHQVRTDSVRLAFEVAHVYIDAIASEAREATLSSVVEVFREAEQVIMARAHEGDASGYEVRRLHVEKTRYETELAKAELRVHEVRRSLATLVLSEGEGIEVGPAEPPEISASQFQLEDALFTARLHRPEIAFFQELVEAAHALVAEAHASRLPSPTLTAGYKRQSDGFNGPALGLALPLPVLNRNRGTIEARQAELHAAETQLILVQRKIENDVRRAYETQAVLAKRIELVRDSLLSDIDGLLRIARISYDEGEMLLVELLDAAEAYRDAQIMAIDLSADFQTSHYDLLRAIGGVEPSMR